MISTGLFQYYKNKWKNRGNKFPESKFIIKYAFTVGGIDYHYFDDVYNLPYMRGLQALSVYEEVRMSCDRDHLKAYTTAINNILTADSFNMNSAMKMKTFNDQLIERLNWISTEDLLYKICSVVFFDESEKPQLFEEKYAAHKVAHWKKHQAAKDFFLQQPIKTLLPFLNELDTNFQSYMEVISEFSKIHLENIYLNLSEKQKNQYSDLFSSLSVEETNPK